jgi:hypothetical protein
LQAEIEDELEIYLLYYEMFQDTETNVLFILVNLVLGNLFVKLVMPLTSSRVS